MESKAAQDLAAVLTGDQAKVKAKAPGEFKAPKPKPRPRPRARPASPTRGPKSAQRGRSPAKTDKSDRFPSQSPISRKNRGQAMKDRSRSRSTSITRAPEQSREILPAGPEQQAEIDFFTTQQPSSNFVLNNMPKSRLTEREKENIGKKLAEEDKKRRAFEANSKRQQEELEANSARLQEREKELNRKQEELDRQKAEFERQRAEADLKLQTALGQGQPNAYTTRILAAQGPGVGPGVGPVYETTPPRFFNPPDPGDSVSRTRDKSPDYAIAEGKKKKNRKRSVKNKKGNKKKKKGGKVSKKN